MKHKLNVHQHLNKLFRPIFSIVFIFFFFLNCSSSEQDMRVSGYRFIYSGNTYFIRSICCPNSPQSCNHLIGKGFEAVDLNQDRIIDKIVKGDITIPEAQTIYSYALNKLEKENKLSVIDKNKVEFQFIVERPYMVFQITSFKTEKGDPFNQFKVVQKRSNLNYDISLFNDLKADGTLDEILEGNYPIVKAQKHYKETIEEGVRANKIVIADSLVRVK